MLPSTAPSFTWISFFDTATPESEYPDIANPGVVPKVYSITTLLSVKIGNPLP